MSLNSNDGLLINNDKVISTNCTANKSTKLSKTSNNGNHKKIILFKNIEWSSVIVLGNNNR